MLLVARLMLALVLVARFVFPLVLVAKLVLMLVALEALLVLLLPLLLLLLLIPIADVETDFAVGVEIGVEIRVEIGEMARGKMVGALLRGLTEVSTVLAAGDLFDALLIGMRDWEAFPPPRDAMIGCSIIRR